MYRRIAKFAAEFNVKLDGMLSLIVLKFEFVGTVAIDAECVFQTRLNWDLGSSVSDLKY